MPTEAWCEYGVSRPGSGEITRLGYVPPSSASAVASGSLCPGARQAASTTGEGKRATSVRTPSAPPRISSVMLPMETIWLSKNLP